MRGTRREDEERLRQQRGGNRGPKKLIERVSKRGEKGGERREREEREERAEEERRGEERRGERGGRRRRGRGSACLSVVVYTEAETADVIIRQQLPKLVEDKEAEGMAGAVQVRHWLSPWFGRAPPGHLHRSSEQERGRER